MEKQSKILVERRHHTYYQQGCFPFTIRVRGREVIVLWRHNYFSALSHQSHHLAFIGPVSPTGYRSHFVHGIPDSELGNKFAAEVTSVAERFYDKEIDKLTPEQLTCFAGYPHGQFFLTPENLKIFGLIP